MFAQQTCEESSHALSGESAHLGASLKYLYTNAHSLENKQEELEVGVKLQDYDLIGIMEMWWDSSHNWNAAMKKHRSLRTGWGCKKRELPHM